jgi:hypothetical protein
MLIAASIRQYRLCWCFAIACVLLLTSAYANAAGEIQLHSSYCGEFKWQGSDAASQVRFDFLRREHRQDSIEVEGFGWSQGRGPRTNFYFRAVVDPRSGNIVMTESVGPDTKDYETNGSYRGQVERDGSAIVAVWTNNRPPNAKGVLRLSKCDQ